MVIVVKGEFRRILIAVESSSDGLYSSGEV